MNGELRWELGIGVAFAAYIAYLIWKEMKWPY